MEAIYNTAAKPVHAIASFPYKGYIINFSTMKTTSPKHKVVLLDKGGKPASFFETVEKAIEHVDSLIP